MEYLSLIETFLVFLLVLMEFASFYKIFVKKKRTYIRKPKFVPKVIRNRNYES